MRTKTMWTKVALLGLLICGASAGNASKLVITGGDGSPAITRFSAFGPGLSASVTDPPQDTAEATISGPAYQWSGGGSGLSLPLPADKADVLLKADIPLAYGGGGQKNVGVSCTATYTSTDRKTGIKTLIPVPGSKNIQFFVSIPTCITVVKGEAYQEYDPDTQLYIVSPMNGVNGWWGSLDKWTLRVDDNHGIPYISAVPEEDIIPDVPNLTETKAFSMGQAGLQSGEFLDGNGMKYEYNPGFPADHVESNVDQDWYVNERGERLKLNRHHIYDWYGVPNPIGTVTSTHTG